MLRLSRLPPKSSLPRQRVYPPAGRRKGRVALLAGCANKVLKPSINEATIRLLNRLGIEVVIPDGEGCCGSLVHHMGREAQAHAQAKANIDAWIAEMDGGRARRHRHQRVGLRNDGEGLRLHAADRSGLCGQGAPGFRLSQKMYVSISRRCGCPNRRARPG